jgi:KaiC/GvpD/RAD55 family RecA-like ATPase
LQNDYGLETQKLFLEMMLHDAESFVRVQNIYNPENFDRAIKPAAEFVQKHFEDHGSLPILQQVSASTGIKLNDIPDLPEGSLTWFMEEFEKFTQRQELERAILKSADLLEKGDFSPVEKLIKDAVQISLQKDMGTDYFADPHGRNDKYFNSGGQQSTGWPSLDKILYGGFSRGELNIFAGGSGSGKSLVMMNIALSWLEQGLSGVYISLELSEELVGLRTDAMLSNMSTKDIRKDLETATLKVKMFGKKAGQYRVKALPAQSNINDIRSYVKEVQVQTGIKVDFMMVDYLDLLMPVSAKVSPNDLFVKDKYVSEELRNLAKELNVFFVTASQLNRSAVEEIEFDHSHISGGISKINTADNVFGIFTSRAMKERGRYQLQCMKTRTSNGTGQKVELEYNVETMRITDLPEEASSVSSFKKTNIYDSIKTQSKISNGQSVDEDQGETGKITADVQSNKLKAMLGQIKAS